MSQLRMQMLDLPSHIIANGYAWAQKYSYQEAKFNSNGLSLPLTLAVAYVNYFKGLMSLSRTPFGPKRHELLELGFLWVETADSC